MGHKESLFFTVLILLCFLRKASQALTEQATLVHSDVFLSPPFHLKPGSVSNKYYFDISFPRGHIALKGFDAEVVDEMGNPIPLHETYLHHWIVEPYYRLKGIEFPIEGNFSYFTNTKSILARNSGVCEHTLGQYFGLGSETRKTATWVPDPYGMEIGNPRDIPEGYEERWLLNVHAIDTRGVEDRLGCTECKCDLYNVKVDEYERPLPKGYLGGLRCCHDRTQCSVRIDFDSVVKKFFLRYTVKWANWHESIVPVKIYIFDVTDERGLQNHSSTVGAASTCKVEYNISPCSTGSKDTGGCIDTKKTSVAIPLGGDIVYGVAHQHSGGIGSALYGQDGRVLCTSMPTYGNGREPGNEAGYIVGMSTCYPSPGSISVADGEIITVVSNYSSARPHYGVMGLFYILVAEPIQQSDKMVLPTLQELDGDETA